MKKIPYILALLLLIACDNDDKEQPTPTEDRTAVSILTRADNSDSNGLLLAGLFMVNYQEGQHGTLWQTGNYVNNQLLTWNNAGWTTAKPIYWHDMETPADFYAYAPYRETVSDVRAMKFQVQTDQSTATAFAQSDFLWGTVQGQNPTDTGFELYLSHQFAKLTVIVTAGAGFDGNELQSSDVSVTIGGSKTNCFIDLATGLVTVNGTANDVRCLNNGDLSYAAVLIPQQIPFANLIQVDWKGNKYTLQNSFTLESGRQYTLTVKLKKSKSGFDIGIEGWDIIDEDFGGVIGG